MNKKLFFLKILSNNHRDLDKKSNKFKYICNYFIFNYF